MRVGYEVSSLQEPQLTGIGKATLHLWQALSKISVLRVDPYLKASRWKKRPVVERHLGRSPGLYFPGFPIQLYGLDVFHGPDFKIPRGGRFAKVVTVHDLVEFRNEYNSAAFIEKARLDMQQMIEKSRPDLIIAVSEFTKRELIAYFPRTADRIRVVPHGADHLSHGDRGSTRSAVAREKIILFVGTIEKRKNVGRVVQAFLSSRLPSVGYRLKIVGKRGFNADTELARAKNASIDLIGYATARELRDLYQKSALLALPSLYEGFAFPLLEAMGAGLPVLTSQGNACAETAGDAAILVDPMSVESIARGMEELALDKVLAQKMQDRGFDRFRQFTWEVCARRTADVYNEAAKKR